jgi:hypothetical protein
MSTVRKGRAGALEETLVLRLLTGNGGGTDA